MIVETKEESGLRVVSAGFDDYAITSCDQTTAVLKEVIDNVHKIVLLGSID